jgi:hypothetical protein
MGGGSGQEVERAAKVTEGWRWWPRGRELQR